MACDVCKKTVADSPCLRGNCPYKLHTVLKRNVTETCNVCFTNPAPRKGCTDRGCPYVSKSEAVNHPAHYGGVDNPYEVIKVMEAWLTREEFIGAMKFNIHKYMARAVRKGHAEDYAKSAWYNNHLTDYIKRHPA